MAVQSRRHRKARIGRNSKRSLLLCDKCKHVARDPFRLRRHKAKYHRLVRARKWIGKFGVKVRAIGRKNAREPKPQKVAVSTVRSNRQPRKLTGRRSVHNSREEPVVTRSNKKRVKVDCGPVKSGETSRNSSAKSSSSKGRTKRAKSDRVPKTKKKRLRLGVQPINCTLCEYVGRDAYNLKRHVQSKHEPKPPKVPKIYQCEQCEYKNKHRFLVKRHSLTHCRERRGKSGGGGFPCDKCSYVSASACNLKRHQVNRHEKAKEPKVPCSLCDQREPDRPALFTHFREAHGVVIETEVQTFGDLQSFYDWKNATEKATFARFVRQQTRSGQKKHVIFKCHRDGVFKSKSRGERKRALKTTGSNKINSACPACMRLTIDPAGSISVLFTKTHVGHSNEVCRLTLTKEEKILVGEMLAAKRTFQEILSEIRNGMEADRLERIHLLSRKDLQNIERWYKSKDTKEEPRMPLDIDIDSWVERVTEETQIIRFYKRPGTISPKPTKGLEYHDFVCILANNFQLAMLKQFGSDCICIDNTYENSSVKLTSLIVLDDSRQGFPCAFMLSSKIDKTIMKVFVDILQKESGWVLSPSILVSDIPENRRTEWSAVLDLPKASEVFYSTWSVDEDLKRNLNKVKGECKQQEVYKTVKHLSLQLNTSVVHHLIDSTLKSLDEDPDSEPFSRYFKSKFSDNARKWVSGFRDHLSASSSDNLEDLHEILKFIHSEGLKTGKLVDCITNLMKCVRDQVQGRIFLTNETEVSKLVMLIAQRHEDADDMKSHPADPDVFEIFQNDLQCRCGLRCYKCDVCVHAYRCTCNDSSVGWNICRHIHYLAKNSQVEQENGLVSHPFDPAEEKRKLLLEFENMCDDIAAEEDSADCSTMVEVPIIDKEQQCQELLMKQQDLQPLTPPLPPLQPQLDDARRRLQTRFQNICLQLATDADVALVDEALKSIENAISSQQATLNL